MRCNICGSHNITLHRGKNGYYFRCRGCNATVGCHKGTKKPMGIFADREMKTMRTVCHRLFDYDKKGQRRWATSKERNTLYLRLSRELGIEISSCHFSKMSKDELIRCIEILGGWE